MKQFSTFMFLWLYSLNTFSHETDDGHTNTCGLNSKSRALAKLIINDPNQNRNQLVCSSLLSKIANDKAQEMALKGRVKHNAPNKKLIDAGYPLSRIYPRLFENNVEAIAGGVSTSAQMWQGFKDSEVHRMHLLAEHEFYILQNEIGVGYFKEPKSPHVYYWVVYIAHKQEEQKYKGEIAKSKD